MTFDDEFDDLGLDDDDLLQVLESVEQAHSHTGLGPAYGRNDLGVRNNRIATPLDASARLPVAAQWAPVVQPGGHGMRQTTLQFGGGSSSFQAGPLSSKSVNCATRTPLSSGTMEGVKEVMKVGGTERPKLNPSKNVPLANTFNIAAPQRPSNHVVDEEAIKTWVYPTNIGVREYQYNIVSHCLFANTLVALPTGLGKTFIAAVVMYNFFRWFPEGRIVFMAPTKPLVAQQIEACHKIVGIPQSETEELTGSTSPDLRKLSWLRKRVFYLTPQVMQNDLQKETCPAEKVVLLVIDEAHRATGNHAYCEVIRELRKRNEHFRVLALTATPGSDTKTVQQVIENVLISRIEIRTEDSLDIKPYIHQRKLEIVTVALSQQILAIRGTLNGILKGYINRLCKAHAFYRSAPESVGRYELLMARDKWRAESRGKVASGALTPGRASGIEGDFGVAMTLAQAIQLLMQHGIRTSYVHLNGYVEEAQKPNARVSRARMELLKNRNFQQVLSHIRKMMDAPDYCSHPKMERLVSLIIEHFVGCHEEANGKADDQSKVTDTRVMIFSQYRESVDEIRSTLEKHEPMIRVMTFVGQSAGGKGRKGFTQKEQLEVISKFQSGNYNVLVATSIGEEGLDIGEVDLIVCYDIQNSPIRMLQRIGRTGRKRQGKVALLLTEGKEEDAHRRSQAQYKTVQNAILDQQGKKLLMYPSEYCRMLPTGVRPKCVQKELDIVSYQTKAMKRQCGAAKQDKLENERSEGPYLRCDEASEYANKYAVSDTPKLDISKYGFCQTRELPGVVYGRSHRSKTFVAHVRMMETLIRSEEDNKASDYAQGLGVWLRNEDVEYNGKLSVAFSAATSLPVANDPVQLGKDTSGAKRKRKHTPLLKKVVKLDQLPETDDYLCDDDLDDILLQSLTQVMRAPPKLRGQPSQGRQRTPKLPKSTVVANTPSIAPSREPFSLCRGYADEMPLFGEHAELTRSAEPSLYMSSLVEEEFSCYSPVVSYDPQLADHRVESFVSSPEPKPCNERNSSHSQVDQVTSGPASPTCSQSPLVAVRKKRRIFIEDSPPSNPNHAGSRLQANGTYVQGSEVRVPTVRSPSPARTLKRLRRVKSIKKHMLSQPPKCTPQKAYDKCNKTDPASFLLRLTSQTSAGISTRPDTAHKPAVAPLPAKKTGRTKDNNPFINFIDREAALSDQDDSNASSDESSDEDWDRDLSGFVVIDETPARRRRTESEESIGGEARDSPSDIRAFYQRSLLTPAQGGMGMRHIGGYRFAWGRSTPGKRRWPDTPSKGNTPRNELSEEEDDLSGFVVADDDEDALCRLGSSDCSQESLSGTVKRLVSHSAVDEDSDEEIIAAPKRRLKRRTHIVDDDDDQDTHLADRHGGRAQKSPAHFSYKVNAYSTSLRHKACDQAQVQLQATIHMEDEYDDVWDDIDDSALMQIVS